MLVKELFKESSEFLDLQALIMFLVFEKKVLSMEDDAEKLELYFLDKHQERMNKELNQYKRKMNMNYKPFVFEIKHKKGTVYVYAQTEIQARNIANKHLIKVDEIKMCDLDDLMTIDGNDMTFRTHVKGKKPQILGGYLND